MKCFEKLVRSHITTSLPTTSNPHQFAYRANRSTEDTIATALHTTLQHVEHQGSYARLLFIDFSSAFNTIKQTSHQTNGLGTFTTNLLLDQRLSDRALPESWSRCPSFLCT